MYQKFTFTLQYKKIDDLGLAEKTDPTHWCMLEYVGDWEQSAFRSPDKVQALSQDGKNYVWISNSKFIKDMKFMPKTIRGVQKRISQLVELDLLDRVIQGNKSYYRLTELGMAMTKYSKEPAEKPEEENPPEDLDNNGNSGANKSSCSDDGEGESTNKSSGKPRTKVHADHELSFIGLLLSSTLYPKRKDKEYVRSVIAAALLEFDFLEGAEGEKTQTILLGIKMLEYVHEEGYDVNKLEAPLNLKQACQLLCDYDKEDLKSIIDAMSNYKSLKKKYKSAYKTILGWLKVRGIPKITEMPERRTA